MFKVNSVILAGNLTREIDLKYTGNQRAFAKFSVAVNRSVRQQDGSYKDVADFIPVAVWGKTAENCGRYLKKGDNVLIEGRISTRSYEVNGEKKFVVEVLADSVQFPPRNGNSGQPRNDYGNVTDNVTHNATSNTTQNYAPKKYDGFAPLDIPAESEIPF